MEGSTVKKRLTTVKPELELVVGPAGSGKTTWTLTRAAELLKSSKRVMVLLPTARAVTDFKLKLLNEMDLTVVWRPEVLTFERLGNEILRANRPGLKRISRVAQEIILARVIAKLRTDGLISILARLSRFVGLVSALTEWIAEFKHAEITPEAFAEFARSSAATAKDLELAHVYSEYQKQLHELNVYDPEGRFWRAKEILDESPVEPVAGLSALLIDGFYDFPPMELSVLELMAGYGCKLSMTLAYDRSEGRPELFERPGRTLERLKRSFKVNVRKLEPVDDRPTQLRHLERNLFARGARAHCPKNVASVVRFIETPGDLIEVEEIARTIKGELRQAGFALEDVCIIARNSLQYASVAADVFTRYGIPYHLDNEMRLSQTPIGKLALQILNVVNENFPLGPLASLLRSSLLDLSQLVPDATKLAHDLQDVCVEAGIVGGRAGYAPRLGALSKRLTDRLDRQTIEDEGGSRYIGQSEIDDRIRTTVGVGELLKAVFERFEPLLSAKTFAESRDALVRVIDDLGVRNMLCNGRPGRHEALGLRSYGLLLETLDDLVLTAELVGWTECTRRDFTRQAERMMGEKNLSSATLHEVGVSILGVHEARAVSFPVVFVCGLIDRTFPHARREGPFHDDAERSQMERAGLNLRPRRAEQSEEAFLFYLACTRARARLYLTYPVTDREGAERLVSHYVDEVGKLLGPDRSENVRRIAPGVVMNPSEDVPASPSELRRRLIREACTHGSVEAETLKPMLQYVRETTPVTLEFMKFGLAAEAERDSFRTFGPFDGVLRKPLVGKELRQRYGPDYPFSPSALEDYGTCPFRFLCRHVIGLVEPATLAEELSPLELGSLYHDVLWEFFHKLRADDPETTILAEERRSDYLQLMEDIAMRRLKRLEAGRDDLHPVLWKLTAEQVIDTLTGFIDAQIVLSTGTTPRRPSYLEASFGLRRRRGVNDELSTTERLILSAAGEENPISVAGKIDRIDRVMDSSGAFVVIDYKTGSAIPNARDVLRGTSLQLPLYVLAAEGVLLRDKDASVVSAEFYSLREQKLKSLMKRSAKPDETSDAPDDKWSELLNAAAEFAGKYVCGIRRGEFPLLPVEQGCPAHCEFKQICRYSERRVLKKSNNWKPWFHRRHEEG